MIRPVVAPPSEAYATPVPDRAKSVWSRPSSISAFLAVPLYDALPLLRGVWCNRCAANRPPRTGVGSLPALLLDKGLPPYQLPATLGRRTPRPRSGGGKGD